MRENKKKKYETHIEKREHKEIGFSAICFLVVHWVLPCPMDRTGFPEVEGFVGKEGEIELNPDALRSIDPPHLYRQHFDFDETLPASPFPQWKGDTITRRFRMSLQPYRGFYMYNKDPLTGTKFTFPGSMYEHKYGVLRHYIVPEQNGKTNNYVKPIFL